MSFLNKFKKNQEVDPAKVAPKVAKPKVEPQKTDKSETTEKVAEKSESKKIESKDKVQKPADKKVEKGEVKGTTKEAYRILLKPLITEKASSLGSLNKYVFAIDPRMNKVEVKKAVRTIYKVEPIKVNISNIVGRQVRFGKVKGKTKSWKKAVITLRPGDKIEVYEGV